MEIISITRHEETGWKETLVKYMSRASTRPNACELVAEEFGYSAGYIKKAASKMGLLSSEHSLKCIFSEEEEQALVCACIVYSRQHNPLTAETFIDIASFFAEKDEEHRLSRKFFYGFLSRHTEELSWKSGKLTSPSRNYSQMLAKTKEFIATFEYMMAEKNLSEKNIVVFDESIIGDCVSLSKVITERRDSGGGNGNVAVLRRRALGSIIPFSMGDGSTPFRVFIINEKTCQDLMIPESPILPKVEKGLRDTPYRLFLSSQSGYVTIELFHTIMDAFIYWWTTTRPGVACLLISDNLAIHKNSAIVEKAESNGIYMLNIMAGSSHWFQVHDQLPFAILKKKMGTSFYKCFGRNSTDPEATLITRMAQFYEAEKDAFDPQSVRKSFAMVGLQPWNKNLILKNCRENSPAGSDSIENSMIDDLARKISMYSEKKRDEIERLRSTVKHVEIETSKKSIRRKYTEKDYSKNPVQDKEGTVDSSLEKNMHIATEMPKKRAKLMHVDCKTCASEGCGKTHFWSKKWVFCQKCNKNFCEEHKDELYHHQC